MSEFLRNLHFQGYKPDRHIKALLEEHSAARPEVAVIIDSMRPRAQELGRIVGTTADEHIKAATIALVGLELTPGAFTPTMTDNLVWLFGSEFGSGGKAGRRKVDDPFPLLRRRPGLALR